MMKFFHLIKYVVVFTLIQWCILPGAELHAANSDHSRIREISSKKSEQLFIEIAINLLNGKSRFIALDNMVRILNDYNIVELQSEDIKPAKEIILKEVAFRMLKQHYLPRIGDKIKVYKYQRQFQEDAGIHPQEADSSETAIRLPVELTTIKDNQQLKTIHWTSLVMQISTAIEKLWLKRIGYSSYASGDTGDERAFLEAASLLRKKFIYGKDIEATSNDRGPAGEIVKAAEEKLDCWLKEGAALKKDVPLLTEMIIQYIIHSNNKKAPFIAEELKGLKDIPALREALRHRIIKTTANIKSCNPTDYGVFAMLQSLLNEITSRFSMFSNTSSIERPANIDFKESRHSA